MPEITVTETQQEKLENIRSDIAEAYIDTYGQIRTTDVIQYLIDTYTPPEEPREEAYERIATAEFPVLQKIASDVDAVPGSGIDAETMRGELLSTLGVAEFASRLASVDADEADVGGEESADGTDDGAIEGDEEPTGTTDAQSEAEADEKGEQSGESEPDSTADTEDQSDESPAAGGAPSTGGSESILNAANQLLTNHDDKWREGSGEEPYEVDLPDGTSEQVRTKDDVKQLLFKHY